jgi:hypothetical protein
MPVCVCACRADVLDLVEDDTAGLSNPKETDNGCNGSEHGQQLPVGTWEVEDVVVLDSIGCVALGLLLLLLLAV